LNQWQDLLQAPRLISKMKDRNIVLITGYARAGKDTFRAGIAQGAGKHPVVPRNFADSLKEAANSFLEHLDFNDAGNPDFYLHPNSKNFFSDPFKVKHRTVLVELGKFARSLNRNVFAENFTNWVRRSAPYECGFDGSKPHTIVCSDWRYLNEYQVVLNDLGAGYNIITVRVNTIGVEPANEEEGLSIAEITREMPMNHEFTFSPNNWQIVKAEGKNLGARLPR